MGPTEGDFLFSVQAGVLLAWDIERVWLGKVMNGTDIGLSCAGAREEGSAVPNIFAGMEESRPV